MSIQNESFSTIFNSYYEEEIVRIFEEIGKEAGADFKIMFDETAELSGNFYQGNLIAQRADQREWHGVKTIRLAFTGMETTQELSIRLFSSDKYGKMKDSKKKIFLGTIDEFQKLDPKSQIIKVLAGHLG